MAKVNPLVQVFYLLAVGLSSALVNGAACGGLLGSCSGGLICVLGLCVGKSGQGCNNVNLLCPSGLLCIGNTCVVSTGGSGDPVMRGFDGREWEFLGQPGSTYALYSDQAHAINMGLFLGQMHDHNGTYIDSMGFQYKQHKFAVNRIEDGNITLSIDGGSVFIGSEHTEGMRKFGYKSDSVVVEWSSHMPDFGRAVVFTTGTLEVTVWAVPPGLEDEGGVPQPAYLNFRSALLSSPAGDDAQGLLGETLLALKPSAETAHLSHPMEDHEFHGQGPEEDYLVKDLFDTDFKYSLFGRGRAASASRRSAMESAFAGVQFPLIACNDAKC